MECKLTFVTVMTADYDRARAFYTDVLGFEVTEERPGANSFVGSGGAGFALRTDDGVSPPLGAGVTLYFSVPDLDAYLAEVQDRGAEIAEPKHDMPFGPTFSVRSPDGHVLGFWSQ